MTDEGLIDFQGRAALVAVRRSRGGAATGMLGRSYYKGGFEPKMTRREAALILEMPYVNPISAPSVFSIWWRIHFYGPC